MSSETPKKEGDNKPTPKTTKVIMGWEEFCNRNGCTPHERFFLQKKFKSLELTEADWKKKLTDGN